jgi:hypothetical protein
VNLRPKLTCLAHEPCLCHVSHVSHTCLAHEPCLCHVSHVSHICLTHEHHLSHVSHVSLLLFTSLTCHTCLMLQVQSVVIMPEWRGDRLEAFLKQCRECSVVGCKTDHCFSEATSCDFCIFNQKAASPRSEILMCLMRSIPKAPSASFSSSALFSPWQTPQEALRPSV